MSYTGIGNSDNRLVRSGARHVWGPAATWAAFGALNYTAGGNTGTLRWRQHSTASFQPASTAGAGLFEGPAVITDIYARHRGGASLASAATFTLVIDGVASALSVTLAANTIEASNTGNVVLATGARFLRIDYSLDIFDAGNLRPLVVIRLVPR